MLLAAEQSKWAFHAHPDVWLLIATMAAAYWYAVTRWRPDDAPDVSRRQVGWFAAGVLSIWAFADWPAHDIGERYLFSVHMTQHMVFTLVAPGLLLFGLPEWLRRKLFVDPPVVHAVLRRLTRPLVATLLYNGLLVFTHWPVLVNASTTNEPLHFALHTLIFSSALCMWMPVVNRLPELPRLAQAPAMLYLFLQSVVPTVPASFITFAEKTVYRVYEDAPRAFGISAVEDQQLAGAVMKVGGTTIIWGLIVVMFFRWYSDEQRRDRGDLTWADVEREFERAPAAG